MTKKNNKLKKMTKRIKKKMRRNTRRGKGNETVPRGTINWKLNDDDKAQIYLMRMGLPADITRKIVLTEGLKNALQEEAEKRKSKYSDENAIYPSERVRRQMNERYFRPGDNSWRQTGIYKNYDDWYENQTLPPIVFIPPGPLLPQRQAARSWHYMEE